MLAYHPARGDQMMIRMIPLFAGSLLLAACQQQPAADTSADTSATPATSAAPAAAPAATAPAATASAATTAGATPVSATEDFSQFTGTAAAGKGVFVQCQACHVLQDGVNRVGPSLYNIVGRTSGSVPGFRYSTANQNSNIVWTEENLFRYLRAPREMIPGTTMAFAGIPDAQKRADLVAFLKANGQV